MAVLLDTNIIIDHMRGLPKAVRFVQALTGKPSASVATIAELFAGADSRTEEERIHALQAWVRFLDVDARIAENAGQLMKHYQAAHGLDDLDALIAATAEHHGLPLATLNVKHFPMFKKLKAAY